MENKFINEKVNEKIEDIQEEIIKANGRFFRRKEIEEMTIKKILEILLPNNMEINIKFIRPKINEN